MMSISPSSGWSSPFSQKADQFGPQLSTLPSDGSEFARRKIRASTYP